MSLSALCILLFAFYTLPASLAPARPIEGFHEGPYLQFVTGMRDASFDTEQASNTAHAHDQEALFGFIFGWNLTDPWAVELSGHYSSPGLVTNQEHLINVRLGTKWSWVTDALTKFRSVRILPYLSAAGLVQINVLPTDASASTPRILQWGIGPSLGAGISALFFHDAVYCSIGGLGDLAWRPQRNQEIGGVTTMAYRAALDLEWSAIAAFGVHF